MGCRARVKLPALAGSRLPPLQLLQRLPQPVPQKSACHGPLFKTMELDKEEGPIQPVAPVGWVVKVKHLL